MPEPNNLPEVQRIVSNPDYSENYDAHLEEIRIKFRSVINTGPSDAMDFIESLPDVKRGAFVRYIMEVDPNPTFTDHLFDIGDESYRQKNLSYLKNLKAEEIQAASEQVESISSIYNPEDLLGKPEEEPSVAQESAPPAPIPKLAQELLERKVVIFSAETLLDAMESSLKDIFTGDDSYAIEVIRDAMENRLDREFISYDDFIRELNAFLIEIEFTDTSENNILSQAGDRISNYGSENVATWAGDVLTADESLPDDVIDAINASNQAYKTFHSGVNPPVDELLALLAGQPPSAQIMFLGKLFPEELAWVQEHLQDEDSKDAYAAMLPFVSPESRDVLGVTETNEEIYGNYVDYLEGVGEEDIDNLLGMSYGLLADWQPEGELEKVAALREKITSETPTELLGVSIASVMDTYLHFTSLAEEYYKTLATLKTMTIEAEGSAENDYRRSEAIELLQTMGFGYEDYDFSGLLLPEIEEKLRYAAYYYYQAHGDNPYEETGSEKWPTQGHITNAYHEYADWEEFPSLYEGIIKNPIVQVIAGILYEPLDWIMTAYTVIDDIRKGEVDFWTAFSVATVFLPGAWGRLQRLDEVGDVARNSDAISTLSSRTMGGDFPPTGIGELDTPIYGTQIYTEWIQKLENYGFEIIEKDDVSYSWAGEYTLFESLGKNQYAPKLIYEVNKNHFTLLDLFHEDRHFQQITRLLEAGISPASSEKRYYNLWRVAMEREAYAFELHLGEIIKMQTGIGFSDEYNDFLNEMIQMYWTRPMVNRISNSSTTRRWIDIAEPEFDFDAITPSDFDPFNLNRY